MLWLVLLAASTPATDAHAALDVACGRCHSGAADATEGGFDFLFDREALVREGFVVPYQPRASRLVQRLRKREMPPPDEGQQGRDRALAALERWVLAGAPAAGFDAPKGPASRHRFTAAQLARLIGDDAHGRYFTVQPGEGPALAKALNSLSWRPQLVVPDDVVPGLVRVELEDLGWHEPDWDQLLAAYPFGVAGDAQVLRADWFVANATRPPLYHALARTPANEAGLASRLDVRPADDVTRGAVVRAGFASSGVSQNNRLIERHTTRFGPYWRSYDFASNVGQKNLFEHPLDFVHDGGEHIFSLPNGLFGFLLTDARGGRIDRGPTTIVRDPRRPDGAVENGLSCMGCHARGFIAKADQVRAAVRASEQGFTPRDRQRVELLHPEPEPVLGLFELDGRRYLAALAELGVEPTAEEPITRLALAYEKDLDLPAAAFELGVNRERLKHVLERGPESMAPLKLGGTVKRDAFVAAFPGLVARLGVGRPAPARGRGEARVQACGLGAGTFEARADDCAAAFPERSRIGAFRLVARAVGGAEVWLDETRRLVWSEAKPAASQAEAALQCGKSPLVDALWFLPAAVELEAAVADGLPGLGWQPLWTRDVDNGHKHDTPGVAVGVQGRTSERPERALPSRCAARL